MADVREEILARLVAIAAEVPGVVSAGRNRIGLSETARPAIIVLDADEVAEEEEQEPPGARPAARRDDARALRAGGQARCRDRRRAQRLPPAYRPPGG